MDFQVRDDYGVELTVYGRRILASPAVDSIIRFTQNEYDYLRYFSPEYGITCEFLGQAALGELVGLGIPDSRQRNSILDSEYKEYLKWQEMYDAVGEGDVSGFFDLQSEIDSFLGNNGTA